MNCEFEEYGDRFRCVHCKIVRNVKVLRECPKRPQAIALPPEPGRVRQLSSYAIAVARWELAGSPTRTPAVIDAILEICHGCPLFIPEGRPRCRLCGCSINNRPNGLKNKIAMATESCPDDPPRWGASVVSD